MNDLTSKSAQDLNGINGLYCTLCFKDLNHRVYKICQHPRLCVPLCILCHDDIATKLPTLDSESIEEDDVEVEEVCDWCGEGEELFLCSNTLDNGRHCCKHACCKSCVLNNLGEEVCKHIEQLDEWKCFYCDSSQLSLFQSALSFGQSQSIYSEKAEQTGRTEEQMAVDHLCEVVTESALAASMLEEEHLEEKRLEIEDELCTEAEGTSITANEIQAKVAEEVDLYCRTWQQHMDIMVRQEADLCELVASYDIDVRSLPVYALREETLASSMAEGGPEYAISDADFERMRRQHLADTKETERKAAVSGVADAVLPAIGARATAEGTTSRGVQWEEEVEEEEITAETLAALQILADTDPFLRTFDSMEEVGEEQYPRSFAKVQPIAVLKALYYGSLKSPQMKTLIAKFAVPNHIVLVMSCARKPLPRTTDHWSFAHRVHPAVRKALFHLSSVLEQRVVCAHYGLDEELSCVTDFGSAADICDIVQERKRIEEASRLRRGSAGHLAGRGDDSEDREGEMEREEVTAEEMEDLQQREDEAFLQEHRDMVSEAQRLERHIGSRASRIAATRNDLVVLRRLDEDDSEAVHRQRRQAFDPRQRSKKAPGYRTAGSVSSATSERSRRTNRSAVETSVDSDETQMEDEVDLEGAAENEKQSSYPPAKNAKPRSMDIEDSGSESADEDDKSDGGEDGVAGGKTRAARKVAFRSYPPAEHQQTVSEPSPISSTATGSVSKVVTRRASAPSASMVVDLTFSDDEPEAVRSLASKVAKSKPALVVSSKKDTRTEPEEDFAVSDEDTGARFFQPVRNRLRRVGDSGEAGAKRPPSTGESRRRKEVVRDDEDEEDEDEDEDVMSLDELTEDDSEAGVAVIKRPAKSTASAAAATKKSVPVKTNGSSMLSFTSSSRESSKGLPAFMASDSNTSNTYDIRALSTLRKPAKLSDEQLAVKYFQETEDEALMLMLQLNASARKKVLVVSDLVPQLKPHQKEGLRFLWRNTMEASYRNSSASKKDNKKDNGCVLAHCMGLGKTFSVIAFVMTLLTNPAVTSIVDSYQPPPEPTPPSVPASANKLPFAAVNNSAVSQPDAVVAPKRLIHCVLIVAPLVTIENWQVEFRKWTPRDLLPHTRVVSLDSSMTAPVRLKTLRQWHQEGGVMIMGYDMLRTLTTPKTKPVSSTDLVGDSAAAAQSNLFTSRTRKSPSKVTYSAEVAAARRYLLDPGPDLVVADEAHQLSNAKSKISVAFNEMRTKRRIALTGSPLQNNLVEYWCMVDWVKHYTLYSLPRFKELFVVPIQNGDKADADPYDVKQMRKKVFVLNKRLRDIVDRKDFSILAASLKTKRQYVLCVRMTRFQQFLYKTFLQKMSLLTGKVKLFAAYQCFLRLWNHPCCTVLQTMDARELENIKAQQLVAALAPKGKAPKPVARLPGSMVPYKTFAKELSITYNYFTAHSTELLAALEASTRKVEEAMLRPSRELEAALAAGVLGEEGNEFEEDEDRGLLALEADEDLEMDSVTVDGGSSSPHASEMSKFESACALVAGDEEPELEGAEGELKRVKVTHLTASFPLTSSLGAASAAVSQVNQSFQPIGGAQRRETPKGTPRASPVPAPQLELDWWKVRPPAQAPSTKTSGITFDLTDDYFVDPEEEKSYDSLMTGDELLRLSNKMVTFLTLLALSVLQGDKMLVFSQSLYTLDVIEHFLKTRDWSDGLLSSEQISSGGGAAFAGTGKRFSNWRLGNEYLRIDGKTKDRQSLIDKFNKSVQFKLFMVCTKAGNMGINLYSANRVVIFDSSWNPVHDLQAISRSYRYGQQKEVFVYRLVAADSMEEVIYKRQMAKQALAARVVDAQMPDNQAEGGELMDIREPAKEESSQEGLVISDTVKLDAVLMGFVDRHAGLLSYIADQEVLLEDKVESHLNAEDQAAAEAEYEREIAASNRMNQQTAGLMGSAPMGMSAEAIAAFMAARGMAPFAVARDSQEDSQPMDVEPSVSTTTGPLPAFPTTAEMLRAAMVVQPSAPLVSAESIPLHTEAANINSFRRSSATTGASSNATSSTNTTADPASHTF